MSSNRPSRNPPLGMDDLERNQLNDFYRELVASGISVRDISRVTSMSFSGGRSELHLPPTAVASVVTSDAIVSAAAATTSKPPPQQPPVTPPPQPTSVIACPELFTDIESIIEKLTELRLRLNDELDEILKDIDNLSASEEDDTVDLAKSLFKRSNASTTKIFNEHKIVHNKISKIGKSIDKVFAHDYDDIVRAIPSLGKSFDDFCFNDVIHDHLVQRGFPAVANCFAEEANLQTKLDTTEDLNELRAIIESLRARDVRPALLWCATHSQALADINSKLQFAMLKLQFICQLTDPLVTKPEMLTSAKTLLKYFADHSTEIQQLMGAMAFKDNNIENSPYAFLLSDEVWLTGASLFHKDWCRIKHLSLKSPIDAALIVGNSAIHPLTNVVKTIVEKECVGYLCEDELPINIILPQEYQFHSVFSCPILKTQTHNTNPPLKLECGHVLSRDAITKATMASKVKCPYCGGGLESDIRKLTPVFF